jgi:hypothetical protein
MKFKRILKAIGLGIVDSVPVLSSIKNNIANPHLATEDKPLSGMGQIDYIRLITALTASGLTIAFLMGKITIEDLKQLIEVIK